MRWQVPWGIVVLVAVLLVLFWYVLVVVDEAGVT